MSADSPLAVVIANTRLAGRAAVMAVSRPLLVALLAMCVAGGSWGGAGAACVDYGAYFHWLASDSGIDIRGLALGEGHAYGACGDAGVRVFATTAEGRLTYERFLDTPGTATRVHLNGSLLYVADGSAGLQIVDVTNPAAPQIIGTYNTPGNAYDVVVVGQHAYIADGTTGLLVLDVSQAAAPALVGIGNTPGTAQGLVLVGTRAFVADGASGLQIISVSDPATPAIVGFVDTPGSAAGVAVAGSIAAVADGSGGFQVVDVAAPAAPLIAASVPTPKNALSVIMDGNRAFVTGYTTSQGSFVMALNLENPGQPAVLVSTTFADQARHVAIAGQNLYVAAHTTIEIFDVSMLEAAPAPSQLALSGDATDVAISGHFAYVASNSGGLHIVDLVDPAAPVRVGGVPLPKPAVGVCVSGTGLVVVHYDWETDYSLMTVFDITDPVAPAVTGSLALPWRTLDFDINGQYVYAVQDVTGNNVLVTDIGIPAQPQLAGSASVLGATSITVHEGSAYVGRSNRDLVALDLGNPAAPAVCGYGYSLQLLRSSAQADLLVGVGPGGIYTVGLASPCHPEPIAAAPLGSASTYRDVLFMGRFAYATNSLSGIHVYEIDSVEAPRIIGAGSPVAIPVRAAAMGDYLIVAAYTHLLVYPFQCDFVAPVPDDTGDPAVGRLSVSPNPVSRATEISFSPLHLGPVQIDVYDLAGRRVKTLHRSQGDGGELRLLWSGDDQAGRRLGAGVYLVRAQAGRQVEIRRAVLID